MDCKVTVKMLVNGDRYTFEQRYFDVEKPEKSVKLALDSINSVFQGFADIRDISIKVMNAL